MRSRALLLCVALLAATASQAQPKQEREAPASLGQSAEVGQGSNMGRQPLRPGAYITPRHRQAVQQYLAKHHGPGKPCLPGVAKQGGGACRPAAGGAARWAIGQPVPKSARALPLPAGLRAALPKAPPGNQYVLLNGDILLIASASRIVVDAVPAAR